MVVVDIETDCRYRDREFEPQPHHITFVPIDHVIHSIAVPPSAGSKGSCQLRTGEITDRFFSN